MYYSLKRNNKKVCEFDTDLFSRVTLSLNAFGSLGAISSARLEEPDTFAIFGELIGRRKGGGADDPLTFFQFEPCRVDESFELNRINGLENSQLSRSKNTHPSPEALKRKQGLFVMRLSVDNHPLVLAGAPDLGLLFTTVSIEDREEGGQEILADVQGITNPLGDMQRQRLTWCDWQPISGESIRIELLFGESSDKPRTTEKFDPSQDKLP